MNSFHNYFFAGDQETLSKYKHPIKAHITTTMTINKFQAFIAAFIILGNIFVLLSMGIQSLLLFYLYFGICSFAVWFYYICFYNQQRVSKSHPVDLEILYACCSLCTAAYDADIKNNEDLNAKTTLKTERFMDWSKEGNRSISLITEINGKPLKLSETEKPVKVAVMSFRGTSNHSEVMEDMQSYKSVNVFALDDVEKKKSLFQAGAGFVEAYYDIREIVQNGESMMNIFCNEADTCGGRVLIVGHSLGGAMAQIMASELSLMRPEYKIALVTFGQPRLFSIKSAQQKWNFEHWRAVNDGDPVPTLPLRKLGFSHHGKAFHFNTNNSGHWNVIEGYTDFDGLDGLFQLFLVNLHAHHLMDMVHEDVKKTGYSYMSRLKEHLHGNRL
mmetsp:Transcript_24238/g.33242  ORF Transcript_24238/g.33242 Transcript_24238/m.33242 type:complete len:386 (+) Transcript_24238:235-1392(+)